MFNTPILDIFIGLVLLFLLYSLLATSLKEGIASTFGLRARMLRKGIVEGMLTCSPVWGPYSIWSSIGLGARRFFTEVLPEFVLIKRYRLRHQNTLGGAFYEHPIIKNYGSSGIYPYPSYLPARDFSTILVDTLKSDFYKKIEHLIADLQKDCHDKNDVIRDRLLSSSDIAKIQLLLEKYTDFHAKGIDTCIQKDTCFIDEETMHILVLFLMESLYNIDVFKARLERWFEDSMHRVSGWYKRQVQFILFFIGLAMAITFNLDVLEIAGKLSKDDKMRDQLLQSAVAYGQMHKGGDTDKHNQVDFTKADDKLHVADSTVKNDIKDVNHLLALGYGGYGADDPVFIGKLKKETWYWWGGWLTIHSARAKDDECRFKGSSSDSLFFAYELKTYPFHVKKAYIGYKFWWQKKMLGFLIMALAVCLGAPFWFDMLSKIINLRSTGDKENGASKSSGNNPASQGALTVNVNNGKNGQEAVG